MRMLMHL
jgi:hypothetical protein